MCAQRVFIAALAILFLQTAISFAEEPQADSSPDEVKQFFEQRGKVVLTFVGYSGAGYEDEEAMLRKAREVLSVHSPKKTIVNIGATPPGIGAVYELARKLGFETTGIVSSQARKYEAGVSPHVDKVFYIADETWGGFKANSQELNPTSAVLVLCSDVVVGIGGGEVARDELIASKRAGKAVKFIPADMNHKTAIDKAIRKGLPVPTDFQGAAFEVFGKPGDSEEQRQTEREQSRVIIN
jgi:hypothetical protein